MARELVSTNLAYELTLLSPRSCRTACRIQYASFFGVCIRLGMTFNYPVLWVRVEVKGQG